MSESENINTTTDTAKVVMTMSDEFYKSQSQQNHPDLEELYFIDRLTNERIYPNGHAVDIDNDMYTGKLLIMVRTGDADGTAKPAYSGGTASNDRISTYFRSKKRRFEIQFQVKFKKVTDAQIYLSIEYDHPVKQNILARTSIGAAMKFCKMKNPSFSYSLQGKENATEDEQKAGLYENPHFAFPMTTLDVVKITKAGEKPPELGKIISEDSEAYQKRFSEGIDYNLDDTYTICLWSSYVDFVSWKAVNLPAIPKFSLTKVNGAQPMIVKVYALNRDSDDEKRHLQKNLTSILHVEVSRRGITSFGKGAREWIQRNFPKSKKDDESSLQTSYYTTYSRTEHDAFEDNEPEENTCCCTCM